MQNLSPKIRRKTLYGIMQNLSPKIRRKTLFLQRKSKIDGINPKGMEHPNIHLKSDSD